MASNGQQCHVQRWIRSYGLFHIFRDFSENALQIEINRKNVNVKVLVWDVSTQEILKSITCHVDTIYSLAVNRDGSYIATTSKDRKLRVIEPRTSIVISVGFISMEVKTMAKVVSSIHLHENDTLDSQYVHLYIKHTGRSVSPGNKMFKGCIFGQWKSGDHGLFTAFRPTIFDLGSA